MNEITRVGVDLAKRVIQVHAIDATGRVVAAKALPSLERKWISELDYHLMKELWVHDGNRIAVRSAYEWHDDAGNWFVSYGNENREFDAEGYMSVSHASINDKPIQPHERLFHWPQGPRPDGHPGLTELGL